MGTYISLLRGINVSGQKKVKMADLRGILEELGFLNIRTYIQSGNLVFDVEGLSSDQISQRIKKESRNKYDFDVGSWTSQRDTFIDIVSANPYAMADENDHKQIYFVFLNEESSLDLVRQLEQEKFENEQFKITPECIFLHCLIGYGKAKCNNNFFEKRLKVEATTRNLRTVRTLIELSK